MIYRGSATSSADSFRLAAASAAATLVFTARKLPALVEIIMRSRTGVSPGVRYAISTLLNYLIIGAAVVHDSARRIVVRSLTKTSILACVFLIGALIWLLRSRNFSKIRHVRWKCWAPSSRRRRWHAWKRLMIWVWCCVLRVQSRIRSGRKPACAAR